MHNNLTKLFSVFLGGITVLLTDAIVLSSPSNSSEISRQVESSIILAQRQNIIALQKRTGGTLSGKKHNPNVDAGHATASATLYFNGVLQVNGNARSDSRTSGTRATFVIVGQDSVGNALFVKKVDVPTACGLWDACSSERHVSQTLNVDPSIVAYTTKLDLYVGSRGPGANVFERTRRIIRESYKTYDSLPPEVKAAIAAAAAG